MEACLYCWCTLSNCILSIYGLYNCIYVTRYGDVYTYIFHYIKVYNSLFLYVLLIHRFNQINKKMLCKMDLSWKCSDLFSKGCWVTAIFVEFRCCNYFAIFALEQKSWAVDMYIKKIKGDKLHRIAQPVHTTQEYLVHQGPYIADTWYHVEVFNFLNISGQSDTSRSCI